MALFHFGKKEQKQKIPPACVCNGGCPAEKRETSGTDCLGASSVSGESVRNIKVLGAGCKSCRRQYENAQAAVRNMGLNLEVNYVTDMEKAAAYGVMRMPALVVNEKVVASGTVLSAAEMEKLLHKLGF